MDDWISTRDASEYLHVSERTTRRWAREVFEGAETKPRGAVSRLTKSRRTAAGRYYLDKGEIEALREEAETFTG